MISAALAPLAVSAPMLTFLGVVVIALSAVMSAGATALVTRRASARSSDLEERRVGLDEFEAHKNFMSGQIKDLRAELVVEHDARVAAEGRADTAERRADEAGALAAEARGTARRLDVRVGQLEAVLRENGMPIPPQPLSA